MSLALDAVYALVAAVTSPWWARKSRGGWAERFGQTDPLPVKTRPRLLIHAVSVGEVNLTKPLVERLRGHVEVVISVSTDTGIERARKLYDGACRVVRYPLDASWSVRRFLDAVSPDAVALVELEMWPNFLTACARRGIPVAVVNGRLSERSFGRYRLGRAFLKRYFGGLAFAAVQDQDYAERFQTMGVPPERCIVAGSMKWDSADTSPTVAGADDLAKEMGIDRSKPLVVAGSTEPGEPELLREAIPPGVQLLCAPRKPEWFDACAAALSPCVRRSGRNPPTSQQERFVLDTIGELRKAYSLADVVVIGRSFGELYGSDPMEAAALGKPIVIGPRVDDFRAAVAALEQADGLIQTTREELGRVLRELLIDHDRRRAMGERARACVIAHQGAAARHAELILDVMRVSPTSGGEPPS